MRELAQEFGTRDVALRKMLRRYGVTTPPQGHLYRVYAARQVPAPPKARARRLGENGRVLIDPRFTPFVAEAERPRHCAIQQYKVRSKVLTMR